MKKVDNNGTSGVPRVQFNYGYDDANNLSAITDTINGVVSGVETFSYDALNRVEWITQTGNGVVAKRVEFDYDKASQLKSLERYRGLTGTDANLVAQTDYDYDDVGRLTDIDHVQGVLQGGNTIAAYDLAYDPINRLTELTTPDGTSVYSYDDRHQVTDVSHTFQTDEAYSYDENGNRTNTGYDTGDGNRLLSDGVYTYTYDNEGNRTSRTEDATGEVTEYGWDYRNRLVQVVTKDSDGTVTHRVDYTYDALDRRIEKTVDDDGAGDAAPVTEHMVYDGEHIALMFDESGTLTDRYLHGPGVDQVLAQEDAETGAVWWALMDHQGTVRDVVDHEGNLVNHIVYDSFGQITGESDESIDFRFGFTGRETDAETDLYYYRARYYDPAVGQFIAQDPIGFDAGDANLYRYVFNSPTNYTDPSGNSVAAWGGRLVRTGVTLSFADGGALTPLDVLAGTIIATGGALLLYDHLTSETSLIDRASDAVAGALMDAELERERDFERAREQVGAQGRGMGQEVIGDAINEMTVGSNDPTLGPNGHLHFPDIPPIDLSLPPSPSGNDTHASDFVTTFPGWFDRHCDPLDGFETFPLGDDGLIQHVFDIDIDDPNGGEGAVFEPSPKHGSVDRGNISRGPTNGQNALDNSVQVKQTSTRRVGVDEATGEIVVLDETTPGIFHGHVRSWDQLRPEMKNALRRAGLVDRRGRIISNP